MTRRRFAHHLKSTLPDYMIPAIFTPLEAFPLTASGKLDRRALPAPDPGARAPDDSPVVAPRTPVEQLLAEIWGELLGLEQIGVHDNSSASEAIRCSQFGS